MLLFELAFAAGMREGERYALMPYELERRDGVPGIHVQQQIQAYGLPDKVVIPNWLDASHLYGILWLTTPKTRAANRFVPIGESLWTRLWARIHRLNIAPHGLVFTNQRGNPILETIEAYHWRKALQAAGLPQVRIHSARHWTATMTAQSGMPDDARTAIMGHTSLDMTAHHTHWQPKALAFDAVWGAASGVPVVGVDEFVDERAVFLSRIEPVCQQHQPCQSSYRPHVLCGRSRDIIDRPKDSALLRRLAMVLLCTFLSFESVALRKASFCCLSSRI